MTEVSRSLCDPFHSWNDFGIKSELVLPITLIAVSNARILYLCGPLAREITVIILRAFARYDSMRSPPLRVSPSWVKAQILVRHGARVKLKLRSTPYVAGLR